MPSVPVASATKKQQHVVEAWGARTAAMSVAVCPEEQKEDGCDRKRGIKGVEFVDRGVGMLDDAVEGVVARMVRWTDDE